MRKINLIDGQTLTWIRMSHEENGIHGHSATTNIEMPSVILGRTGTGMVREIKIDGTTIIDRFLPGIGRMAESG